MTTDEKRKSLARYRLDQATDTLDEAEFLLTGGKSPRAAMNRAYYSMYYAVLALLIFEPFASSKHTGVLAYFNRRFVKEGVFPASMGRAIHKAFELRQRGDYREFENLSIEQVMPFLDEARQFIVEVSRHLEEMGV